MEQSKPVIKPTVGRVVLYYPHGKTGAQPYAATIAYVHSDSMINIGFLDANGMHGNATSVVLLADPDGKPPEGYTSYATWMPYQLGQAARTAEAEKMLDIGSGG